jgi:hypothetical protein
MYVTLFETIKQHFIVLLMDEDNGHLITRDLAKNVNAINSLSEGSFEQ